MAKCNGDDLLDTFNDLNIDLGNLSSNVVKAWFDTDCAATKSLLIFLTEALSSVNYVSPLERAEYDNIEEPLSSAKCLEELAELNPNYSSMLDGETNLEDLLLIQDEIDLLEDENKNLDKLIKRYEDIDNNISLDLTYKTQKEIQSKIDCKKSQEACEILSISLDNCSKELRRALIKYDPDSHFVNFIHVDDYHEDIEKMKSLLGLLIHTDQSFLEESDEHFSNELEICRKRILHSHQIYLVNKVEMAKLKEIFEFLNNANVDENMLRSINVNANLPAKELYKKRMCDVLDSIATKHADHYVKQTRIRYVEQEHEELQQRHGNVSKILENVTKYLSYYVVMNCLQLEEKKDVECINNFYQRMMTHVNGDLFKCRSRTEQMKKITEEYKSYQAKPAFERSKLISSIARVLATADDDYTLKSAAEVVGKFKTELNRLEMQSFCADFKEEKDVIRQMNQNIRILRHFLIPGPTNRVVLIPLELREVWFDIEEHLEKENASIAQAVQLPQNVKKTTTKAQNYMRELWINFLANPSKVHCVLQQAEEDFQKRTQHYF